MEPRNVSVKKSQLVRQLSKIKGFEDPKISLEQYLTPPQLAADILHTAYMKGDIEDKKVADFGTGTGILGIGAAILGGDVKAFDKDEDAIELAIENTESMEARGMIEFVKKDVEEVEGVFDTVVMNPPFSVHSDSGIKFLKRAVKCSDAVYSVSHPGLRRVIKDFIKNSDHKLTAMESYKVSLPPTYDFHTEEGRETKIDVLITKKED